MKRFLFTLTIINFIFFLITSSKAQDFETELINLSNAIRQANEQAENVENKLAELKLDEEKLSQELSYYRYESTKAYHALLSLQTRSAQNAYLLPNKGYLDQFYKSRREENLRDIMLHHMNKQSQTLNQIRERSKQIEDYINRRDALVQNVQNNIETLKNINTKRMVQSDLKDRLAQLKSESDNLNAFLSALLNIELPEIDMNSDLIFRLPVSGIVYSVNDGIQILSASKSIVTTPAHGLVVYAGKFNPLGNVILINHGQGYISIIKNLDDIFVQEGVVLQDGEAIGITHDKNLDKSGNNTMLYYELRYNNQITNPIETLTGL